ncbi:MAG: kelch repeat-containing protein [Candidatus Sericytochromatia bacterium]|nr:kelch repeat-containing protein [Candidatus Sericytochromatia bacterium]
MPRLVVSSLSLALLALATGCQRAPMVEPPRPEAPALGTARLELRWPAWVGQRTLLGVRPTAKARITIQGSGIAEPIVQDVPIAMGSTPAATIFQVPVGVLRLFTLRFLTDAGTVLEGLHYGGYAEVQPGVVRLTLSDRSTVCHDVYLDWLTRYGAGAASPLSTEVVESVVNDTLDNFRVPSPRLLDVSAVALALKDATTKNLPVPKEEWVARPGFVSVGFLDFPSGTPVAVSVNDAISAPVVSLRGEPVVLGPIAPSAQDYTLRLTPLAGNLGSDLAPQDVPFRVSQEALTPKMPSMSFSRSTPGDPLPGRLGGGMCLGLGGTEDGLVMLGGLEQPNSVAPGITGEARVGRATEALRYTRAGKWQRANPLPATFPWFGAGVAAVGSKVYVFGGQVAGMGIDRVHVVDTAGTTAATQLDAPLTISQDRYPKAATVLLSECAAAALNGRIFVAGGYTHLPNRPDIDPEPFTEMLSFVPESGSFEPNPPPGLPEGTERASPASAVLGSNWYLIGGWNGNGPMRLVQRFGGTDWEAMALMPTARAHATAVVHDGKIWVIGGEERNDVPSRAVEVYDPATNAWTLRAPLRTPRLRPAAGVVRAADGTARIVVAGGLTGTHVTDLGLPLPANATEELKP